jgi:hypothetical protein
MASTHGQSYPLALFLWGWKLDPGRETGSYWGELAEQDSGVGRVDGRKMREQFQKGELSALRIGSEAVWYKGQSTVFCRDMNLGPQGRVTLENFLSIFVPDSPSFR